MQFIVKAYDGEGMLGKRMEVRPRHLEGIERIKEHVICAGGLLDDEGKMKGSVLIIQPALLCPTRFTHPNPLPQIRLIIFMASITFGRFRIA